MPAGQISDWENKLTLFSETVVAIGMQPAILKLSKQFSREELSFLADQVIGRELAKDKFPFLVGMEEIVYPPSFYMEQTSSERTARFKAGLVNGRSLIDMTGGFGVDSYFFSLNVGETWYVEQDPVIFEFASKNLAMLNDSIKCIQSDSVKFLTDIEGKVDWIYLDPIRRKKDRRLRNVEEFTPNIAAIQDLLFAHSDHVMVKLSPMTDITEAVRIFSHKLNKVYVVAVDNECKELLIVSDGQVHDDVEVESVNLVKGREERFVSSLGQDVDSVTLSDALAYLYEPNAAIFKAQQYDQLAIKYGLFKLHPNTHIYTSDVLHTGYEGKVYKVRGSYPFDAKAFPKSGGDSFNIKTRNFPMTPEQVAKKLGIREGGDEFLFCVKLKDEKPGLIVGSKAT